jgi:hypothetical protein
MQGGRDRHSRPTAQSQDQFALYLARRVLQSGGYRKAIHCGRFASRSTLALQVVPHVLSLFLKTHLWGERPDHQNIFPGTRFYDWKMPRPLIPNDRIYDRTFKGVCQ